MIYLGKALIQESRLVGLETDLNNLEKFTSYYIKIAAFTKVNR